MDVKEFDNTLRSANRRILSASEWATQAGLLNIAAELRQASKEFSSSLIQKPYAKAHEHETKDSD